MQMGIDAACREGVRSITAGNYGGKLGPYHFHLRKIMSGDVEDAPKPDAPKPSAPAPASPQ
jgi:hypothetical protein